MRQRTAFRARETRTKLGWVVFCSLVLPLFLPEVLAQGFSFDNGRAGWNYQLFIYNSTYDSISYVRSGSASWIDRRNYPTASDPVGNGEGAIRRAVWAGDYDTAGPGEYLVMQFESPDLSTRTFWQDAQTFSAKLLPPPARTHEQPFFANLGIVAYDRDEAREWTIFNHDPASIDADEWTSQQMDITATLAEHEITDYEIVQVLVSFWVAVEDAYPVEGEPELFVIDEVVPFACDVFDDMAAFHDAAGNWIRYGFEVNGLSEDLDDMPGSPVDAANFDDHFDIAYANLDAFNVAVDPGGECTMGLARSLYTHSVASASDYSLTFSNFEGVNSPVTAFGLIVCDFASYMSTEVSITWDTDVHSGTLLKVPTGQASYTKNFIGIVCRPEAEFTSITLTFDDNASGRQFFDKVHYAPR